MTQTITVKIERQSPTFNLWFWRIWIAAGKGFIPGNYKHLIGNLYLSDK